MTLGSISMDGNMTTVIARNRIFTKHANEFGGTHWTSPSVSREELKALCLSFSPVKLAVTKVSRDLRKQANIGGEQEGGFEQAFSSLGYAYLKDKAPRLIDYIVGFQLVDRNEDNTKSVGVFGFKVGKQWLYAPVFFLNGDLKGHELLYIKNQDTFVPMKENWVNYIMSRKPHVLGEGSKKDVFQLGGLSPNIDKMSFPPPHNKYGMAVDAWAQDFLPPFAACVTKQARFMFRGASKTAGLDMKKIADAPFKAAFAEMPSLEDFLSQDWQLAKLAYDWTKQYPGLKVGFDRFHGKDFFQRVAIRCKQAEDAKLSKQAADARNIFPGEKQAEAVALQPGRSILPAEKRAASDKKVKILTKADVAITRNIDEKDKEKILHHGYLVKDERTGEEVTRAYNTQVRVELQNPQESGLYEVLEAPGDFNRMLIIGHPHANDGTKGFFTAVRLGDGNKPWINAHGTALFAKKVELQEDYEKWFKGLGDKDSLAKDSTYMAVNDRGEGTCPFTVKEKYEDGRYRVNFHDSEDYSRGARASGLPKVQTGTGEGPYISTYNALLVLNQRNGSKLRAIGGELHVPDTFKFFKLKEPPKPKKSDDDKMVPMSDCCGDCGSDPKPIQPGNIADIQALFTEKTAAVKFLGDHNEVSIKSAAFGLERYNYGQALFALIRRHGLTEKTAKDILTGVQYKANAGRNPVTYRFKYADNYPLQDGGPTAPPFPAPQYGAEPVGYNSVNAIYPQEEQIPVPGLDSSRTDPRIYDPFLQPDQHAVQMAQQAGQEGQKEVFDTSMIAGMVKSVRQDSLIDRHLGDLMKAVDKLARILFTFYWHGEEFEDRYGKAKMPELEDSLRNSFETLGDLVLFLKEQSIEPNIDDEMGPDIEETARN